MTPAIINDKYIIRFCVNAQNQSDEDINNAWEIIKNGTEKIFEDYKEKSNHIAQQTYQADRFIEIEGLVDLSKLRRQAFVRMVSDPIKIKSNATEISVKNFKKMARLKTVQYSREAVKELDTE